MYRTTDPRFRRRLNEIGQTLESANETAQSSLYIFGQRYVQPCLGSVGNCLTGCVDASCPGFVTRTGDNRRRGGRRGGVDRAELSFDFYDDWDFDGESEEVEGLLGWGNDSIGGYGTVAAQTTTSKQPGRQQRGMSYSKVGGRRKSVAGEAPVIAAGHHGFWGRLFGGKPLRYHPSAADLQEHPGSRRLTRDVTEGEALLEESGEEEDGIGRRHRRGRSGTQASHDTGSSYSSRGDLFPSDNEDDAIPLDDEFAMVLERRTTQSGGDTENSSNKTSDLKRGKRPSAGSRTSTRRTFSSRSSKSEREQRRRSRTNSHAAAPPAVIDEASVTAMSETLAAKDEAFAKEAVIPEPALSMSELKQQERELEAEEEAAVERKRQEALRAAAERGLVIPAQGKSQNQNSSSRDDGSTPRTASEEPSQLPTPLGTDDEVEQLSRTAIQDTDPISDEAKGNHGGDDDERS